MSKSDESPQASAGESRMNPESQHHSRSKSKNKFKHGSQASSGEIKEDSETVKNLDNDVSGDAAQESNRKRNRKELESQSKKLRNGLSKKKKKEDDGPKVDDDNDNGGQEYIGGNQGAEGSGSGNRSDRGRLKSWAGNSSGFEAQIGPFSDSLSSEVPLPSMYSRPIDSDPQHSSKAGVNPDTEEGKREGRAGGQLIFKGNLQEVEYSTEP
jgi:hypothetical protein